MRTVIVSILIGIMIAVAAMSLQPREESILITRPDPVYVDIVPLPHDPDPVFVWPINGEDYVELSSPFGERDPNDIGGWGDDYHDGIDLYGTWHARVLAIADGIILEHWLPPGGAFNGHSVLGGAIWIDHGAGLVSVYGHLSETYIHEGEHVVSGQLLGRQGMTGRTDSEHLHFEVWQDGVKINPLVLKYDFVSGRTQ